MAATTKSHPKPKPAPSTRRHSLHGWRDEMFVRVLEFAAVWLMAFGAIPVVGQLMHLAWGEAEWTMPADTLAGVWLLPFGVIPAVGGLVDVAAISGWALVVPAVLVAAAGGLSWLTFHEAAPRGTFRRWRAAVTVAVALLALAVTDLFGFIGHDLVHWWIVQPWANLYALTAFVLCVSWNIPRTQAVAGTGGDDHAPPEGPGGWADVLGVPKPVRKVGPTRTSDDGIRHEITLEHIGLTQLEVGKNADRIPASIPGMPPTAARVVGDPNDATRTKIALVTQDVLRDPEPWPGPSRPGGSITEPCRTGVYEDGEPEEILRPGDPKTGRPSISVLTMGTPNAGKTEAELLEIAEDVTRDDVLVWWVDTAKGAQTAEDIRPAIDWLVTDKRDAKVFAKALRHQINYRAGALALLQRKFKAEGRQWTRAAWQHLRIPYLKVVFEEFGDLMEVFDSDIVSIGEQVRSVGISLHISLQRATGDRINTSLRSSLGAGWAFGIKDASDANLVLSETTLSMGANPGAWGALKPGMNYLEASQVDPERRAMPARTYRPIPVAVLHWHIAWWSQLMAPLDRDAIGTMPPDVRKVYDARSRCDLMEWIEGHGVDLRHPPVGTPLAAVEAVQRVAAPALAAKTERPVDVPTTPPDPEPGESYEPVRSAPPMTTEETETMIRNEDKMEARATARAGTDPKLAELADMLEAAPEEITRPDETYPAGDGMPLGDDLPQLETTPNEAFIDALREVFDRHPGSDVVHTDTSEVSKLLAARGFYSDSNPRPFVIDRLEKLTELGLAERGERGKGPRASTWTVRREVLAPPPPDTDGE